MLFSSKWNTKLKIRIKFYPETAPQKKDVAPQHFHKKLQFMGSMVYVVFTLHLQYIVPQFFAYLHARLLRHPF
jgi:hypothetical protein